MRVKLDEGAFAPKRAHERDAGIDILSPVDAIVPARGSAVIRTGVHAEVLSCAGVLLPKSGLMMRDILTFGVIDEGYDGEIAVKMFNMGDEDYHVHSGDKITQMLLAEVKFEGVEIVDAITAGERGSNGFGSTGR